MIYINIKLEMHDQIIEQFLQIDVIKYVLNNEAKLNNSMMLQLLYIKSKLYCDTSSNEDLFHFWSVCIDWINIFNSIKNKYL